MTPKEIAARVLDDAEDFRYHENLQELARDWQRQEAEIEKLEYKLFKLQTLAKDRNERLKARAMAAEAEAHLFEVECDSLQLSYENITGILKTTREQLKQAESKLNTNQQLAEVKRQIADLRALCGNIKYPLNYQARLVMARRDNNPEEAEEMRFALNGWKAKFLVAAEKGGEG